MKRGGVSGDAAASIYSGGVIHVGGLRLNLCPDGCLFLFHDFDH